MERRQEFTQSKDVDKGKFWQSRTVDNKDFRSWHGSGNTSGTQCIKMKKNVNGTGQSTP